MGYRHKPLTKVTCVLDSCRQPGITLRANELGRPDWYCPDHARELDDRKATNAR